MRAIGRVWGIWLLLELHWDSFWTFCCCPVSWRFWSIGSAGLVPSPLFTWVLGAGIVLQMYLLVLGSPSLVYFNKLRGFLWRRRCSWCLLQKEVYFMRLESHLPVTIKINIEVVLGQPFNPSSQEADTGGTLNSRLAWFAEWDPGQQDYTEKLYQKTNKQKMQFRIMLVTVISLL